MKIKVMSFNTQHCLNYITRKIDFDVMADAIRKCGADVVGLQEIRGEGRNKAEYAEQAKILAEKLGFYWYFAEAIKFSGTEPYGNALLSRYPIVSARTIIIPDPKIKKYPGYYETRCLLSADIDTGEGGILKVLVSHFGLNPDEQKSAVNTVTANIPGRACVLMGDFNIRPNNRLLGRIREKMNDTAAFFPGGAKLRSFPSDKPNRKIDYIFVTPDVKTLSAGIPDIVASDHRPHVAELEIRGTITG